MSQLVYRVLGPLRPERVRWVLDLHGLAGTPAELTDTARRCDVDVGMIKARTARVRAAGTVLSLSDRMVSATMRGTRTSDDHLGRSRITRTIGLPAPTSPPMPAPRRHAAVPSADIATARAATRILAATGPLDMSTLLGALARSRRWKGGNRNLNADTLGVALSPVRAITDTSGYWRAAGGSPPRERYRSIVDAGGGRDLSRRDMVDILAAAEYT